MPAGQSMLLGCDARQEGSDRSRRGRGKYRAYSALQVTIEAGALACRGKALIAQPIDHYQDDILAGE